MRRPKLFGALGAAGTVLALSACSDVVTVGSPEPPEVLATMEVTVRNYTTEVVTAWLEVGSALVPLGTLPLLRATHFQVPLDGLVGSASARLMTRNADGDIMASEVFPLGCGVCVVLVVTDGGIYLESVSEGGS